MTAPPKAPREWWITFGAHLEISGQPIESPHETVRVIEYSAYAALKEELGAIKIAAEFYRKNSEANDGSLREEIEYLNRMLADERSGDCDKDKIARRLTAAHEDAESWRRAHAILLDASNREIERLDGLRKENFVAWTNCNKERKELEKQLKNEQGKSVVELSYQILELEKERDEAKRKLAFIDSCRDAFIEAGNTSVEAWMKKVAELEKERDAFKNFHSNLCKRFGYWHDEINWRRDQASLEEHIANLLTDCEKALEEIANVVMHDDWGETTRWCRRIAQETLNGTTRILTQEINKLKKECKHPGCCCVCGHEGKCPECGPSIIEGVHD